MKIFIEVSGSDYADYFDVSFEGLGLFMTYASERDDPEAIYPDTCDLGMVVRSKDFGNVINYDLDQGHTNLEIEYQDFIERYRGYREEIEDTIVMMIRDGLGDIELEIY